MALRDQMTDSSKTGPGRSRESAMRDVPLGPQNLAEEAQMDRRAGRPTHGTR